MKPKIIGVGAALAILAGGLYYWYSISTVVDDSAKSVQTASASGDFSDAADAPSQNSQTPLPDSTPQGPAAPPTSIPTPTPIPTPNPYDSVPQAESTVIVQWGDTHEPVAGATIELKGSIGHMQIDWSRRIVADAQGKASAQFPDAFDWLTIEATAPKAGKIIKSFDRRSSDDATDLKYTTPFADPLTILMERGARAYGVVRRADNGAPVAGARVLGYTADKGPSEAVVAGPDGRFSLEGLSPGKIHLEASAPGLCVTPDSQQHRFIVRAGEVSGPRDIAVMPTATISGIVSESPGGAPIKGAIIQLDVSDKALAVSASTGANGSFVLPNVPSGFPVRVVASSPGRADKAAELILFSGDTQKADFQLDLEGIFEAEVKDPAGKPVAGASIMVDAKRGLGYETLARTDANGQARVGGLDATKPVRFMIYKAGFPFTGLTYTAAYDEQHMARSTKTISPRPIVQAIFEGVVRDSAGRPLAGAEIAYAKTFIYTRPPAAGAKSAADGTYRLGPIAFAEKGILIARGPGLAINLQAPVVPPTPAGPFRLDFTMDVAAPVAGRLLADAGGPIAGARVALWPYTSVIPSGSLMELLVHSGMETLTDKSGRFSFPEMPDASWVIMASAEGYTDNPGTGEPFANGSDIVLKPQGVVSGRVIDAKTKKPVKKFKIGYARALRSAPQWKAIVDPQGRFAFDAYDPLYIGALTVESDGYSKFVLDNVKKETAKTPNLTLELKPSQ